MTLLALRNTNVIFASVPYIFTRKNAINQKIYKFNCDLYNCIEEFGGESVSFVDINSLIEYRDMSLWEIHLTRQGKSKLCQYIASLVNKRVGRLDATVTNLNKNLIYVPTTRCF